MDQSSKGQGCLHDPCREDVGGNRQVQEEEQEQALIAFEILFCGYAAATCTRGTANSLIKSIFIKLHEKSTNCSLSVRLSVFFHVLRLSKKESLTDTCIL